MPNNNTSENAPSFEIPTPEAWPQPVNGTELLNELKSAYEKYVILPDCASPALALWTLQTYAYDKFEFAPRLAIVSPEKRCGKSTLLTMLYILAHKTLTTSNISSASIYRVIEVAKPTLLIDEADTFLRENREMGGILNAGHRIGGAVIRTEYKGKTAVPMRFKCFAPCAIAAINKHTLPGPLLDRSIIITMRRKLTTEHAAPLRIREVEAELYDLQRKCLRFMEDNAEAIAKMRPQVPTGLSDRAADNWEAMLAIADFVSQEWGNLARNAAVALHQINEKADDEESIGVQLLYDLREIFGTTKFMASTIICEKLGNMDERIWFRFGRRHESITPYHLGRLLKRFGISSRDKREGLNINKSYFLTDLQEAFERYLPPPVRDTATPQENESFGVAESSGHSATVAESATGSPYDCDWNDIPF